MHSHCRSPPHWVRYYAAHCADEKTEVICVRHRRSEAKAVVFSVHYATSLDYQ